jgi:hypothetical protein
MREGTIFSLIRIVWLLVVVVLQSFRLGCAAVIRAKPKPIKGPNRDAFVRYLPSKTGAMCLDGSQAAYYIRRGLDIGSEKWVVFFEGGGWCYDFEQCSLRSQQRLGSSKMNPDVMHPDELGFYISSNLIVNPLMYNWNTIYVRYCDGSSYAGNATVEHQVWYQ